MSNYYISSVGWAAVTAWSAAEVVASGVYRRQTAPAVGSERVFKCTTPGTTGGAEPSWTLTNNGTTNDNGVVWTQVGGQEAEQLAGNWRAPLARMDTARTLFSMTAADIGFVSSDHAETKAAASAVGASSGAMITYVCVSRVGATLPPTAADVTTGATVSTTGTNDISLGRISTDGIQFNSGSGAVTTYINIESTGGLTYIKNGKLKLTSTGAGYIYTGSAFTSRAILENTPLEFSATTQGIRLYNSDFNWINTVSAIAGATIPTTLIQQYASNSSFMNGRISGVDLSAITGTLISGSAGGGFLDLMNVRINSAVTTISGAPTIGRIRLHNVDDSTSGRNYRFQEWTPIGQIRQDIVLVRTGGANDGTLGLSHKFENHSGATGSYSYPLEGPWIAKRHNTTGSSINVTIELLTWQSTAPTSAQIWFDVEALTSAGYPLGTRYTSKPVTAITAGTTLTASTQSWDSAAPARANSTAYALAQAIKVASNPGRVFFCTAAGTSAGSEPAGFATAVDGDSIVDNGATFRCMWRHKITVSFTPEMKGMVRGRVCIAQSAGVPVWTTFVDPKLTIS